MSCEIDLQEQQKLSGVLGLFLSHLFSVLLTFLLAACTVSTSQGQGETVTANSNPANQTQDSNRESETNRTKVSESKQKNPCPNIRRPLNPDSTPQLSETAIDRYFRLAYDAASAGEFNTAIANYRQATKAATCECDRSHALAGEQAAREAKELLRTDGSASKPTQFFWNSLQELTKSLSCVTKQ